MTAISKQLVKIAILILFAVVSIIVLWRLGPIPQPLSYHNFADARKWMLVPNFLNVASNVGFLIVGALAVIDLLTPKRLVFYNSNERLFYLIMFIALILVAFGSSYYHWAPSNATLFWDRLPIALVVMAFFAAQISERINLVLGFALFPILMVLGAISVMYWQQTEIIGQGDLRVYIFVLFYPMLAIPLMLLMFKSHYTCSSWLWWMLLFYAIARICEGLDLAFYKWTFYIISGHSLKHVFAAIASYFILLYLRRRQLMAR